MKLLFLKSVEIENAMNKSAKLGQSYEVSVDDDTCEDVVCIIENNIVIETLPIEKIFPILEKVYEVKIKSFDFYEVCDLGEGFAFFIE